MIKVKKKNNIITISGHANYDNYGNDIVCSSVSSIVYTTINGILNINSNSLHVTDEDTLTIEVLSSDLVTNKLIENMMLLLSEVESKYPKNISISKGE